MRLGHSVPGADPTSAVFSPRNSEYLGTQQPVSQQMWDQRRVLKARVSPGSPLSCSRPCWYARQQHIPGLQDQFKPIWRRVSWVILGMGELSLGTERWGHAWFPVPSHPQFILYPPGHIMSPGAATTSLTQTERFVSSF